MKTTLGVEPAYDAATIRHEVEALAERLDRDFADDRELLVVSLLSGSVIFVADLVRSIRRELRYEFIQVEQSGENAGETLHFYFPIPVNMKDKTVLLVKDVVSTGVIETYLSEQLMQLGASDLRVVALVDMTKERRTAFEPNYHVFSVDRQGTLVGYGLKQDGLGGNLPYMGWVQH